MTSSDLSSYAELFRANASSVLFATSQLRPRELKMANGLRRLGWTVGLIYYKWTPFDPREYFDFCVEAGSAEEAHALAGQLSPRVTHVFSGAIDDLVLQFCRQKPSPVIVDLNDVFAPSLFDYCHERFEPTREALALAEGFCARDLQAKSAERVDNFRLPPQLLFFPEYCWNTTPVPQKPAERAQSDDVHVVSVGTFSLESQGMYDSCYLRLTQLLIEQEIHFHIYPHWAYRRDHLGSPHANFEKDFVEFLALEKANPYLHVHESLPIEELSGVLPQYDFGIVSGGCAQFGQKLGFYHPTYLETCYSGRIADYLDARLPVLVNDEVKFDYWLLKRLGACVDLKGALRPGFKQILLDLKRDGRQRETMNRAAQKLSVDCNSPRLASFYREIIAAGITTTKIFMKPTELDQRLAPGLPAATRSPTEAAGIKAHPDHGRQLMTSLQNHIRWARPRVAKIVLPYRAIRLLEIRLHNALQEIDSACATIETLRTQVANLERDKVTICAQVIDLEQDKTALSALAADLEHDKAFIRAQVVGLEQDKVAQGIQIERLEQDKRGLGARIEGLEQDKAAMRAQVIDLEQDKTALRTLVADLEQDKAFIRAQVVGLEQDKVAQGIQIERLEQDKRGLGARIEGLEQDKVTMRAQGIDLEQDKAALRTQGENLERDNAILNAQVEGLEHHVAGLEHDAAAHQSQLEAMERQVNFLSEQNNILSNEKFVLQQESRWGPLSINEVAGAWNWPEVLNDVERSNGFAELIRILVLFSFSPHIIDKPSTCWDLLALKNYDQLLTLGYGNFKRTIGHNYFNFLVQKGDPQIQAIESLLSPETQKRCWDVAGAIPDDPAFPWHDQISYKYFVLLLWEYAKSIDSKGYLGRTEEPMEGNPILVSAGNQRASQDLANSLIEYYSISESAPFEGIETVLEIGGGYGRSAYPILALNPKIRVTLVDIPPALFVAQRYLASVFKARRVFRVRDFSRYEEVKDEMGDASIVFLMPHQLALMPDSHFDLSLNISSFGEMTTDQIQWYFKQLGRTTRQYFYMKQWRTSNNVFDATVLSEGDYPFPGNWQKIYSRPCKVQIEFFETLFKTGKP